jgi:hypothetical protein
MKWSYKICFFALSVVVLFFSRGMILSDDVVQEEFSPLQKEADKIVHPPWIKLEERRSTSRLGGRATTISYVIQIEESKVKDIATYYDNQVRDNDWLFKGKSLEKISESIYYLYEKDEMIFRLYVPNENSKAPPSITFGYAK